MEVDGKGCEGNEGRLVVFHCHRYSSLTPRAQPANHCGVHTLQQLLLSTHTIYVYILETNVL